MTDDEMIEAGTFARSGDGEAPAMTDGMERAVEAAARAMWDVWRQHVIAPSFYREITWDWMLAHPDEHPVSSYLDAARKEAAAALIAALPLVGVEREDVARAICEAMDDRPNRSGPYPRCAEGGECACWSAADRVLALPHTGQPQEDGALRVGLAAAIRAAKLALFVIRKQNVMPNSSWQAGFEKDLATAETALGEQMVGE